MNIRDKFLSQVLKLYLYICLKNSLPEITFFRIISPYETFYPFFRIILYSQLKYMNIAPKAIQVVQKIYKVYTYSNDELGNPTSRNEFTLNQLNFLIENKFIEVLEF
jgi:hypothetical protein